MRGNKEKLSKDIIQKDIVLLAVAVAPQIYALDKILSMLVLLLPAAAAVTREKVPCTRK